MGRSRVKPHPVDDDSNQSRSKRQKTISNVGHVETTSHNNELGQGLGELKAASYHCNYCNKDISGRIRMKCVMCPDFDLCIECFSVGAEATPHKSNHPYRVMDNLSFPFLCPDWNTDEETLLLEGIEMYGFGNWAEVAEHVGTKSKAQCIDHYNAIYMNSPYFPLPDMSRVMGKNKDDLLAMAKELGETKKEVIMAEELPLKQDSPPLSTVRHEESRKSPALSSVQSIAENELVGAVKKASNKVQANNERKDIEPEMDRSVGEKKPRISEDGGPSLMELSSYNFKRQEFEIEYDNDAEQLLADMEFKDTDTDEERELKLKVLRIYSKRLDERKRRKDFILERNLLYPDPFVMNLAPEEREIFQRFKVFARFHSKEEHEELLKSIILEHQIVKRIQDLQEARAAGCQTAAVAYKFIGQKRKKEAEQSISVENLQAGKASQISNHIKTEPDDNPQGFVRQGAGIYNNGKDSFAVQTTGSSLDDWDITGFIGGELLSEAEKKLCCEIRILPSHYLNMLQTISVGMLSGKVKTKSDIYSMFKVEPNKLDRVYDMLVKKGIALT